MKTFIVQLEAHDDVISARDKMSWSKAPRILVVWPHKGRVLERGVDLLVLQRQAQSLGAQMGIVASDEEIRSKAQALGLPVFSSAVQAQRSSWRRPRGKRRLGWRRPERTHNPGALREQRDALKVETPERTWVRILAFTSGLLAVLALVMFFLPSATIELRPLRETQRLSLPVWASEDIAAANPSGGMPAFRTSIVVEGSLQQPATGKTALPATQAQGSVIFTNLTTDELSLPAGTVLLAPESGTRFELTAPVKLPAGIDQSTEGKVRAALPGVSGNVEAGAIQSIEGPLGLQALVSNPEALRGGTDRSSPSPTEEDYAQLDEQLKQVLRASAIEEIKTRLGENARLLEGSLTVSQVVSETRDPQPGEPGDFARLAQQIEFTAWYVNSADLQQVAQTALTINLPQGFAPLPGAVDIALNDSLTQAPDGTLRWEMSATRELESVWSEDRAARAVVGRSTQEAADVLSRMFTLDGEPVVTLSPAWWVRMPFLSFRIQVVRR